MFGGMNYSLRTRLLREALRAKDLDAFVTSHLPNVRYLTGFTGSHALVVATRSKFIFLTDFRYEEQVHREVTADEKMFGQGSLVELASKKKVFSSLDSIGFERDNLTIAQFEEWKKFTGRKSLKSLRGVVEQLRSVKEEGEIACIKKAVSITDTVFNKILGIISQADIATRADQPQKTAAMVKDVSQANNAEA